LALTPSARLSAAAEVLEAINLDRLIDPQLKAWARKNRFAGSKDRRAIADRVYSCLRRMRTSEAHGGGTSGRALVLGNLVVEDGLTVDEIAALCSGGYGLAALTHAERATLSHLPEYASDGVRLDWPDWMVSEATNIFGDALDTELNALRQRAPLDLRVNLLRATRDQAIAALRTDGIEAEPLDVSPTALRLPPAVSVLNTQTYLNGMIEPQDAASQATAVFADVKPGQTVLDFCAGAGGKTLALAALMDNRGTLLAHDVNPSRLAALPDRAKRSGATLIRRTTKQGLKPRSCDAVFVDAPCSGSGSWRRDPLGKWRLTRERLAELLSAQRDALSAAAPFVKAGGTLTYVTCSVLPSENREQSAWFAGQHVEFISEATTDFWPARDRTDGFFATRFRRRSS
jgi:16S rRNA (cytosine967-C5)-methyltransferase